MLATQKTLKRHLFTKKQTKILSPTEASLLVKPNDRIYMHGVAAFPSTLAKALSERTDLVNVEINHLHIESPNPLMNTQGTFVNNYFIGANQRKYVQEGRASLIPCFLSELPKLMRLGVRKPNIAFLNVSEPDKHGYCSLGVETCTAYAAAETADIIIAQINPHVPRTHGKSFLKYDWFDAVVHVNDPLPEHVSPPVGPVEKQIGLHIANLIPNGSTLQMGIGVIPNAVLQSLINHKNLGIHTEMFSDGVIPLVDRGIITNTHKKLYNGKLVTSFIMGTKHLYDFVDDNPSVMFGDIQTVNDPHVISIHDNLVAINSAVEVDLTGQVCADSVGFRVISGVGGQVDFERGAALSKGGVPIICLKSTTKNGKSTIVNGLMKGAGVTTTRNHVHWVVTEYGAVDLFGKSLVERARLLISVAHPEHREALEKEAFERFKVMV